MTTRSTPTEHPPVDGCTEQVDPPWATGPIPDTTKFVESELFVAGAISTLPPFDHFHPAWALPIARQALHALSEWEPTDG